MKTEFKPGMNRRGFLQISLRLGGAAAFSALLNACARARLITPTETHVAPTTAAPTTEPRTPTDTTAPTVTIEVEEIEKPSPTPTKASREGFAQVALVKTMDRAAGVRRAIELLGVNPVAAKDVLLKPNFNSADPPPGSTHPEVLRTLITHLKEMGAGAITVGDRSGMGDTRAVMERLGVFDLANELGFETLVFDDLPLESWVEVQYPGSHWGQGFLLAAPCLDCGALVQTCCLKTHRFGGVFTLSLKNSVGMAAKFHPATGYNYMGELHSSPHQRRMIAEINAAYTPALVVLDGVEAFVSGGPDRGTLVTPGVILAGTDRVAIDAAGVAILRQHGAAFNGSIFEQEQIARAVELGLGVESPEKIEFLTADPESAAYAEQVKGVMLGIS